MGFGTEKAPNAFYVWTCVDAGGGRLAFKNMKTGRFFSWKSLATSQYGWTVSATMKGNTNSGVYNEGCVTIRSPKENKFLVGKVSGETRSFDHADRAEFNNTTSLLTSVSKLVPLISTPTRQQTSSVPPMAKNGFV